MFMKGFALLFEWHWQDQQTLGTKYKILCFNVTDEKLFLFFSGPTATSKDGIGMGGVYCISRGLPQNQLGN